jgi:hypothetical protein
LTVGRSSRLRFEREARAETGNVDNANRELALYYADQARQPAAALEVARRERQHRRDVRTLDAYAWALFVAGKRGKPGRPSGRPWPWARAIPRSSATLAQWGPPFACGEKDRPLKARRLPDARFLCFNTTLACGRQRRGR